MSMFLDVNNFPAVSHAERQRLAADLGAIVETDLRDGVFPMLGRYQKTLSDNGRRGEWEGLFKKLLTLFMCGKSVPLDGPMIGVSLSIRDSDYFRDTAKFFGSDRSFVANVEWMATCWNATFANTGIWMGKTFEPVLKEVFAELCDRDPDMLNAYRAETSRLGRNFFREPKDPDLLQGVGLPVLRRLWRLRERPLSPDAPGFKATILSENLSKESPIPYTMTGGLFLAQPGRSVVPEMRGKEVYQLNYRWPGLEPVYPMTRLVDELVQIADGVYLGQLVMATKHYSLGSMRISLLGDLPIAPEGGEPYRPGGGLLDYGYQNNGFFLMIDPAFAHEAYAEGAFPELRPRQGESGYVELGYAGLDAPSTARRSRQAMSADYPHVTDWARGWQDHDALRKKFTTFCLDPSTRPEDEDVVSMIQSGESVLQMLQRIQVEISAQSTLDDRLRHFEKLNRLFRRGVAPVVKNGVFQGQGRGYNTRLDIPEQVTWYGAVEPCTGFDYYHGATLNLHLGIGDTLHQAREKLLAESSVFPSALACMLQSDPRGPNVLDRVWANIGRFIFPWAGKSYERISGRKLSMLLDESPDLEERYPERVSELRSHPASWPHYDLVKKNRDGYWSADGPYATRLRGGSWDKGMSDEDKAFWTQEASDHWVFGHNIQDARILAADTLFRTLDINYHPPLPSIQRLAEAGPSPFVRQGYIFLGVSERNSILPMNNGRTTKKVFQFHYRYPMIGGPAPIGTCLDELVEIAEGLFLGQLIYSTVPWVPFHSSVDPAEFHYQLFGYFLLMDNVWEMHRQAIGFDINR